MSWSVTGSPVDPSHHL